MWPLNASVHNNQILFWPHGTITFTAILEVAPWKYHGGPSIRWSHRKEDRASQKQTKEVSRDQKRCLDSQAVLVKKPLKKKEVVRKVWQHLMHHITEKNPVSASCRPNLQCQQWCYHFTPAKNWVNVLDVILKSCLHPHFCLKHI